MGRARGLARRASPAQGPFRCGDGTAGRSRRPESRCGRRATCWRLVPTAFAAAWGPRISRGPRPGGWPGAVAGRPSLKPACSGLDVDTSGLVLAAATGQRRVNRPPPPGPDVWLWRQRRNPGRAARDQGPGPARRGSRQTRPGASCRRSRSPQRRAGGASQGRGKDRRVCPSVRGQRASESRAVGVLLIRAGLWRGRPAEPRPRTAPRAGGGEAGARAPGAAGTPHGLKRQPCGGASLGLPP